MAQMRYVITQYNYDFDATTGGPRLLQLWADTGLVADIHFVPDGQPRPNWYFSGGLHDVVMFYPASMLGPLVDMLRNERPVWLLLDDTNPPGFAFLGAGPEPVGEAE